MKKASKGEIAMEAALKKRRIKYEREYVFAAPRKFRLDFYIPKSQIGIEIQGGIFIRGRHTQGHALLKEYEKINLAAERGIRILFAVQRNDSAVDIESVAKLAAQLTRPKKSRQ